VAWFCNPILFFTFFPLFRRVLFFCFANSYNTRSCCVAVSMFGQGSNLFNFLRDQIVLETAIENDTYPSLSAYNVLYWCKIYFISFFYYYFFVTTTRTTFFFFERTNKRQTTFSLIFTIFGKGENVIMALIVTVFTKFRTIVSHMVQLWNFPHIIFDGTVPFDLHFDFIPRITFFFFYQFHRFSSQITSVL